MPQEERRKARGPEVPNPSQYAGVGIQLAGAIVIFAFAGWWVDGRLGTEPWFLLLGVFVGAGAGFYSMYRQMVILPRERERERQSRREGER